MKSLRRASTAAEVRGRVECLLETDERRWGVMTAAEAVRHLHGAFQMATGKRRAEPVAVALPRPVMKRLALLMPMHWPKNLPTIPELQQTAKSSTGSTEFENDKQELLAAYDRFLRMEENRTQHPMFGGMEPWEWMRWGYLHTDHHLRQFGR